MHSDNHFYPIWSVDTGVIVQYLLGVFAGVPLKRMRLVRIDAEFSVVKANAANGVVDRIRLIVVRGV